jgi:hypothetical protein
VGLGGVLDWDLHEHLRNVSTECLGPEAPDEAGLTTIRNVFDNQLRRVDNELVVHRGADVEEMRVEEPVHRVLDWFHDFGNATVVEAVAFNFRF